MLWDAQEQGSYELFDFTTAHENGIGSHGEHTLRAVGFSPFSQAHASRKLRGRRGYPIWHFQRSQSCPFRGARETRTRIPGLTEFGPPTLHFHMIVF